MSNEKPVVILLILTGMLFSQPDTLWTKTYGGSLWDYGWDVYEQSNKNLLIVGSTASFGAGYYDVYLIGTDSLGDTIWTKTYGTSDNECPFASCKSSIGGYYIVGYKGLMGSGNESIYLFKTNENGDSLWVRIYSGAEPSYGWYICPTSDGNYLICASIGNYLTGNTDAYVLKINENGDTLWTWRYARTGAQGAHAACNTFDGNYLIEAGDDYADICLIKMTADGDTLWSRRYGGVSARQCAYICPTSDNTYMMVGYVGEYGSGEEDIYLLKVNENGDSLWAQAYGGDTSDYGVHIYETPDTNYLVVGYTYSYGASSGDVYLLKIDKGGNLLWTQRYGGGNLDAGHRIYPTLDGGYLIIGQTMSYGAGLSDVYLVRLGQEPGISEKQTGVKIIATKLMGYPNPFSKKLEIRWQIVGGGQKVSLRIYDITGGLVRNLLNTQKGSGNYTTIWDGKDEYGRKVSPGVYFLRIEDADSKQSYCQKILKVE